MSIIDETLQKAAAEPGLHYFNPTVPRACILPGGLSIGTKIYLQGVCTVPCSRAQFNLQQGSGDDGDICLHVDAKPMEEIVVRSTRRDGNWGSVEKDGGCPFVAGQPFLLVISVSVDNYRIEFNGKHFTTFNHRDGLPPTEVTHLAVFGDIMLQAIHVPVENMPETPFCLTIPGSLKLGDQFSIKGIPEDRFVINWQCCSDQSDDIVLHLNPRFGYRQVVRNSRVRSLWSTEEVDGEFPFTPGVPFHMHVYVAPEGFQIRFDEENIFTFAHRQDYRNAGFIMFDLNCKITDIQVKSHQDSPKIHHS